MLVVDASVVLNACLGEAGLEGFPQERLVAPPLLWSEVGSVLHEMRLRSTISQELAVIAVARLDEADIQAQRPPMLRAEAWRIADQLGDDRRSASSQRRARRPDHGAHRRLIARRSVNRFHP